MVLNIVQTEDGSITCIDNTSGELYHNRIGAYTEALEHYVAVCDLSAHLRTQSEVSVLDVCFGLGYNSFVLIDALLQQLEISDHKQSPVFCHILGIDKDKMILDLIPQVLADSRFNRLCKNLDIDEKSSKEIVSQWQKEGEYKFHSKNKARLSISIAMKIADLRTVLPQLIKEQKKFDYIFHDGFSPRTMPELWTIDIFEHYTKLLSAQGRIITYSSAYAVRGALRACGLEVRKSAPLGGKSGGTVAFRSGQPEIVDEKLILFLSNEEAERLKSRSSIPYRDPDFNRTSEQIIQRRNIEIEQYNSLNP